MEQEKKTKKGVDADGLPLQVHMRLLIEQRDYIKRLATNRTINPSGEIGELVSRGLVYFFAAAPYSDASKWEWKKPQSTYITVAGERLPNPGWCAAHYILCDIEEGGNKYAAKSILAMVKSVGATISAERGLQQVMFSAFDWITTKLYPPHIYDLKHLPNRFQIEPAQLQMLAKKMASLKT